LQSEPVPCCGAVAHRSVLRVLARQSQPQAVVAGRTEFARPHRLLLIAVRLHGDGVHHHLLDRKAVLTAQFVTSQKCPAPVYKGLVGAGRVPWRRSHPSTRAPGSCQPLPRRFSSSSAAFLASSLVLSCATRRSSSSSALFSASSPAIALPPLVCSGEPAAHRVRGVPQVPHYIRSAAAVKAANSAAGNPGSTRPVTESAMSVWHRQSDAATPRQFLVQSVSLRLDLR